MMKRLILGVLLFLLLLVPLFGDYAEFYYNLSQIFSSLQDPNTGLTAFPTLLIPLGGNYEGMGTAYTAVSTDSGFLEANPSASSTLAMTELSFIHHSWIADSNIEGVIYTVRYNHLGIGFGGKFLYIPFTEYNEWGDRAGKGYISESIGTLNVSYNFLSTYKFYGLAVGGNLKIAYRNIPAALYPNQSALTGMIDVGVLTRFNLFKYFISRSKNFSVGAVIKNVGMPALQEPLPTEATLGIAYSPIRPITLAFDFSLPINFVDLGLSESWSLASGINVVVTDFLSVQSGFQLKGENPHVSVGTTVDLKDVSFIVNYNMDLSGRLNPLDKFSVEAKLNLGDRGRLALSNRIDELYLNGLESYANGDLEEAINYWEDVLELDPTFGPARENIETAKKALRLQQEMNDQLDLSE